MAIFPLPHLLSSQVPGDPPFRVLKLLSVDPANYSDAPREGIRRILEAVTGRKIPKDRVETKDIEWIRMGTTVATNALLERKGTEDGCPILWNHSDHNQSIWRYPNQFDSNSRNSNHINQVKEFTIQLNEISPNQTKNLYQYIEHDKYILGSNLFPMSE